jgi:hypothetical protein
MTQENSKQNAAAISDVRNLAIAYPGIKGLKFIVCRHGIFYGLISYTQSLTERN